MPQLLVEISFRHTKDEKPYFKELICARDESYNDDVNYAANEIINDIYRKTGELYWMGKYSHVYSAKCFYSELRENKVVVLGADETVCQKQDLKEKGD